MTRAVSGGFDMVLELAVGAIDELARAKFPTKVDEDWALEIPFWGMPKWGLRAEVHLALSEVALTGGVGGARPKIAWSVSAAGSQMCWDAIDVPLLPPFGGGCATFGPTLNLSAELAGEGKKLSIEQITATVTLAAQSLESIPGVAFYLSLFDLVPGGKTSDEARDELYALVESGLNAVLDGLLPDSLPLVTLPVQSVLLGVAGSELRVMMNIDTEATPPSNPSAITRSVLRRAPAGSTNQPTDLVALIVANDWLMRSTIRPALGLGLKLDPSGFRDPHPCFWSGAQTLVRQWDLDVNITQALGQIDQAGNALVSLTMRGGHSTGAFSMSATATIGLNVEITNGTLHVAVLEPKLSGVDLEVAWWVYVLAAFFPGDPLVLLALGIADACAGGDAVAALVSALTGKLHVDDLAVPIPSLLDIHPNLVMHQDDAEWQMANVPIGQVTVPLAMSRANDVIGSLYRQK